jgi:hypothetical protein
LGTASDFASAASGWQSNDGGYGHVCNCIGCCDKCGHCLTSPAHTPAYCELLQRQAREREDFLNRARKERDDREEGA